MKSKRTYKTDTKNWREGKQTETPRCENRRSTANNQDAKIEEGSRWGRVEKWINKDGRERNGDINLDYV